MTHLLDTNVCIVHLRGKGGGKVAAKLATMNPPDVAVCSIVVAELLYGALRSQDVAKNFANVRAFVQGFTSLPFDDAAAERHAEIRAALAGKPIGPHDFLIAAIALANNLTLVTNNIAEFARVPGLQLEDWQTMP
jgi:tRNA(fMet)-specific endonuclease VapC